MNILSNHFIKYLVLLSFFIISQQVPAATYTASTVAATGFDTTTTPVIWDNVNTAFPNDDDKELVNIGFTFYLGSIAYTQVRINTNGALDFGADQAFQQQYLNTSLPTASGDRLILPYWDDLADPAVNTVSYDTIGSSPNRRFVATWQGTPRYGGTGSYTFQVVLYEATGQIRFRYGSGDANGSSATIGVQVDSTDYTQYSYNTISVSPANDVLFSPTFPLISTVVADCSNYNQVVVNFQSPVQPTLATDVSNYAIDNGISVTSVTVTGPNTVTLQTSTMAMGINYTLQTLQPVAQSVVFSVANTISQTYRDEFNAITYAENDGTANWTGNWTEINEANGPASGDIAVVSNQGSNRLRVRNSNVGAMREVDLSSYTTATLSFLYRRQGLDTASDYVTVAISNDGITWNTLATYSGAGSGPARNDSSYVAVSFTINAAYLTATTRIRFLSSSTLGNRDQVFFDNIQILGTTAIACAVPGPDHYAISYPNGNPGITCEALAVRVSAHDISHNIMAPSATTTITLSSSPAAGGWALKSGNGTFTAPNQYTFNGTETFVEFWLTQTTATTAPHIDINVTDGTATDLQGDATEDVNAQFDDAIFRFFAAGTPEGIGTQIAGKSSSIAPGNQTLELRAVQTNTTTKKCEAALVGTTSVDMAYECNNPATCSASNALSMSTSVDTQTIARNNNGSVASYTPLNMVFDANGIAPFDMTYSDVGQMTLHARKTLTAGVGAPPSTAKTLVGASNTHIVRPFGFDMDFSGQRAADYLDDGVLNNSTGTDSSYSADANGSKFQVAGASFPMSLRAVLWNSADDTDNNGIPDACADLSNNATTSNFGNETTAVVPANVVLAHTLLAPAGGVAGTLSTGANGASFASGVGSKTISWDEVGITNIDSTLTNYLGSGQNVLGNVCNVGRFYPNNFVIVGSALTNRSDIAACPDIFTYMGENFQIAYNLEARNAPPIGAKTQNYTGTFAKLNTTMLGDMNYGATDAGTNLTARLGVSSSGGFSNGAATVSATMQLARNATPDGVYSNFALGVAPVDSDGVGLLASGLNLSLDGGANTHGQIGQTDIRYGRLNLKNNFGSELLALTMPLTAEYYLNPTSEFVVNTDDSCTTRAPADVLLYNDQEPKSTRAVGNPTIKVGGTNTTTLTGISPFVAGQSTLTFSAPSIEGYVDVEVQTPSWLLSDLDGIDEGIQGPGLHCIPALAVTDPAYIAGCTADANSVDDVPLARGNFGIFKGSDRIIYLRESVP